MYFVVCVIFNNIMEFGTCKKKLLKSSPANTNKEWHLLLGLAIA